MSGHTYIIPLHVNFFFNFLIYYLLYFPPIFFIFPQRNVSTLQSWTHFTQASATRRCLFPFAQRFQLPTYSIQFPFTAIVVPCREQELNVQRSLRNRPPKNCCPVTWSGREPRDQQRGHSIWKPSGIRYIGESFPRSSSWNGHHSSGGEKEKVHVCSQGLLKQLELRRNHSLDFFCASPGNVFL